MVKEVSHEEVRDAAIIAAAQRVEDYEMAGYGTARTYAILLVHDDAASMPEQALDEEKEADQTLSGLAEQINVEALQEESEADTESQPARKASKTEKSGGRHKRVA